MPRSAAVHALTAGAMATMILAVMTRATLGHTGRELRAGPLTTLIYVLVTIGPSFGLRPRSEGSITGWASRSPAHAGSAPSSCSSSFMGRSFGARESANRIDRQPAR